MVKQITVEDGVIITEQSLQLGGMASNPSGAPREPGLHPGARELGPAAWGRARESRDDSGQASFEGSPAWEAAGTPGPGDEGDGAPSLRLASFQTSEEVDSQGGSPRRDGEGCLPCVPGVSPLPRSPQARGK